MSPAEEDIKVTPVLLLSRPCEVITRRGEVESLSCYSPWPFICKVDAKDAPYDVNCDIYGTGKYKTLSWPRFTDLKVYLYKLQA